MIYQVLTAASVKTTVWWVVVPSNSKRAWDFSKILPHHGAMSHITVVWILCYLIRNSQFWAPPSKSLLFSYDFLPASCHVGWSIYSFIYKRNNQLQDLNLPWGRWLSAWVVAPCLVVRPGTWAAWRHESEHYHKMQEDLKRHFAIFSLDLIEVTVKKYTLWCLCFLSYFRAKCIKIIGYFITFVSPEDFEIPYLWCSVVYLLV
jgi:hypothetical protein